MPATLSKSNRDSTSSTKAPTLDIIWEEVISPSARDFPQVLNPLSCSFQPSIATGSVLPYERANPHPNPVWKGPPWASIVSNRLGSSADSWILQPSKSCEHTVPHTSPARPPSTAQNLKKLATTKDWPISEPRGGFPLPNLATIAALVIANTAAAPRTAHTTQVPVHGVPPSHNGATVSVSDVTVFYSNNAPTVFVINVSVHSTAPEKGRGRSAASIATAAQSCIAPAIAATTLVPTRRGQSTAVAAAASIAPAGNNADNPNININIFRNTNNTGKKRSSGRWSPRGATRRVWRQTQNQSWRRLIWKYLKSQAQKLQQPGP